jgi:hypothetical protein
MAVASINELSAPILSSTRNLELFTASNLNYPFFFSPKNEIALATDLANLPSVSEAFGHISLCYAQGDPNPLNSRQVEY